MVLHVLLSYSGMNDRDFEQFEMGKKYFKRIKEVANDIVYNYYSDICDPNDLEIKWYYNCISLRDSVPFNGTLWLIKIINISIAFFH